MKKDHGSGQLVLFDMPGTENTVNIKKIMLGSEIFERIKSYENDIKYIVLTNREDINQNADKDIRKPQHNLKQELCKIIFNKSYYKYSGCFNTDGTGDTGDRYDHFFYGLESDVITSLELNFEISYRIFYKDYLNKIAKVKFLKAVIKNNEEDINKNLIKAYNILFKYFTLNITSFKAIGIKFENEKIDFDITKGKGTLKKTDKAKAKEIELSIQGEDSTLVENSKIIADDKISKIGIEMALFFNGKTGSTIYDIKSNDEICFLKDGDFKTIFENFINQSKHHIRFSATWRVSP